MIDMVEQSRRAEILRLATYYRFENAHLVQDYLESWEEEMYFAYLCGRIESLGNQSN